MKFKNIRRALSILLAFAMLSGLCPLFSMGAEQEEVTILFEEESKRTENEKHYFCSDGSSIAVSYPRAVHYLDENGAYVDIDNSLSYNEETAAYENTGNPAFGVSLSDFDGLETVKVKGKDKEEITFSTALLIEGNGKSAKPQKKNINALNNKAKNTKGKKVKDSDTFDLPLVSASLEYGKYYGEDLPAVTGKYSLVGNSLKEDIVLNAPAGVTGFLTTYKAGGMTLTKEADGSLTFKDEEGNGLYTVGAPYMYDAAGSPCPAITVSIAEKGNKFEVTYLPDDAWLTSSERVYPLTFDPILEATPAIYYDVYYETRNGVTNTYNNDHLSVSRAMLAATDRTISYLYIQTFPEINLHQYELTSAELKLYAKTVDESIFLSAYRLAESSFIADYLEISCIDSYQPAESDFLDDVSIDDTDNTYTFDVLSEIALVYSGERTHTGYVLYEDTNYKSTLFYSSEYTDASKRPALVIGYRAKDFDGKYVLKNGSNYLLSQNTTDHSQQTVIETRAVKSASSIGTEDFYYCEWTFTRNENGNNYRISPAYDPDFCLQEVDGTVKLLPIPSDEARGQYWYFEMSADGTTRTIVNAASNKKLYLSGTTVVLSAANALSDSYNFTATRTYQGIYTFQNVGTGGYMEVFLGYNYDNRNIQIQSEYDGNFGKNAFRMCYLPEYNAYRITPISSSNGNFRGIAVGTSSGDNVYQHKNADSIFYVEFLPTGAIKLFTGEEKALALSISGNNVIVENSSNSTNQNWIMDAYKYALPDGNTDASDDVYVDYEQIDKYYFELNFANPFKNNNQMIQTSDFGQRSMGGNSSDDTVANDIHEGIDLRALTGTDLRAPCSGEVVYVDNRTSTVMGKQVIIKTNYSAYSVSGTDETYAVFVVYRHMDEIAVSEGASVGINTLIGTSGNSGVKANGGTYDEHLHYGIFVGKASHASGYISPNTYPLDPWIFYPDILDKSEV